MRALAASLTTSTGLFRFPPSGRCGSRGGLPAIVTSRIFALAAAAVLVGSALSGPGLAAQDVVIWDTALIGQAGQRTLYLRTSNGGNNGLPLGGADVNGDGREDALLCAFIASEATLFLSPPEISGFIEAQPAPDQVTRIAGAGTLGVECAAGDVNGDEFADLVIGAPGVDLPGRMGVGVVYVVFGAASWPAQIDVGSSDRVLRIAGRDALDHFGVWVDVHDVDGDGIGDVLVGAPDADGPENNRVLAGEAQIVYGGTDLGPGAVDVATLIAAGRVFTAYGASPGDKAGAAVDAGRVDAGPVADLVIGSALNRAAQSVISSGSGAADGPDEERQNAGEVAVIFNPERGGSEDLLQPQATTAIVYGTDPLDFAGEEVDVGDADGDGAGDLLIGALTADGFGNLHPSVGEAYVVYGGDGLHGARIDLANPPEGVTTIFGPTAGGITGDTARFIDIDGNGRADVFVGSPTGTFLGPNGGARTGGLFFVRSPAGRLPAVILLDSPPVEALPFGLILATDPGDILAYSLIRLDANGDGVDDVLVNAMTAAGRENAFPNAGEAYVIDGPTLAAATEPFATGDVTADGAVDVRDLRLVAGALVGRFELSQAQRQAADTNGNDELDEGDLIGVLDRVLDRNVLAPGATGGGGLAKVVEEPGYRYDEPGGGYGGGGYGGGGYGGGGYGGGEYDGDDHGGHGAYGDRGVGGSQALVPSGAGGFRLVGPGDAQPPGPSSLAAVVATFEVAPGAATAAVVAAQGISVSWGVRDGRLRILAWSDAPLPLDRPLFSLEGVAGRLLEVTAATAGGSLRRLDDAAPAPARAMPPAVRKRVTGPPEK